MHSLDHKLEPPRTFIAMGSTLARVAASGLKAWAAGLAPAWARYRARRRRRRDLAALARLDSRTLRDIGLEPSNIGAALIDRYAAPTAEAEPSTSRPRIAANDDIARADAHAGELD